MKKEKYDIMAGDKWSVDGSEIRIMAVSEGYVMARRKGAMPFVKSIKDFATMVSLEPITQQIKW